SAFLNRPSASGSEAICTSVSGSLWFRARSTKAFLSASVFCVTFKYSIFTFRSLAMPSSSAEKLSKTSQRCRNLQRPQDAPEGYLVAGHDRLAELALEPVD